ncbi:barstar family protein [Pseudomonas sp. NFR16]|uniref:barstar family protein n=1 Tax=Pseudomonas sp. NFR16 TaxID=1566248 RepID=UPI002108983F|nr:barstar family protein [Pseudomonas sp. NFR16]
MRIDPSIGDADELMRALYYLLWFPGYFGFNWDAFYDCLGDFSWLPCRKIVLVHESLPKFSRADLHVYLGILRDSVSDRIGNEGHELEVVVQVDDETMVEALLKKQVYLLDAKAWLESLKETHGTMSFDVG